MIALINKKQVIFETVKSSLLSVVHRQTGKDYGFWMPRTMVKVAGGDQVSIWIPKDSWTFNIIETEGKVSIEGKEKELEVKVETVTSKELSQKYEIDFKEDKKEDKTERETPDINKKAYEIVDLINNPRYENNNDSEDNPDFDALKAYDIELANLMKKLEEKKRTKRKRKRNPSFN